MTCTTAHRLQVSWTPKHHTLLSTGADGQVLQWHIPSKGAPTHMQRHVLTWQGPLLKGEGPHPRQPTLGRVVGGTALATAQGGAVVGCEDGTVVLLPDAAAAGGSQRVAGGSQRVAWWHAHVGAVTALHWLPSGPSSTTAVLATAGADGAVALWSVEASLQQGGPSEVCVWGGAWTPIISRLFCIIVED